MPLRNALSRVIFFLLVDSGIGITASNVEVPYAEEKSFGEAMLRFAFPKSFNRPVYIISKNNS